MFYRLNSAIVFRYIYKWILNISYKYTKKKTYSKYIITTGTILYVCIFICDIPCHYAFDYDAVAVRRQNDCVCISRCICRGNMWHIPVGMCRGRSTRYYTFKLCKSDIYINVMCIVYVCIHTYMFIMCTHMCIIFM